MKRTMDFIKGCGQILSNDTLFSDTWFNEVKIAEEANADVADNMGS